jgi:hypothetical protein
MAPAAGGAAIIPPAATGTGVVPASLPAVARAAIADAVRGEATATAISPAAAAGTTAAVEKAGATPATAAAQATAPPAKRLKVSLGATRASARAATIAKKREAKHLSGMESPENSRGQTADEQMVRSYRIEFEDPGMQQEKESEEEREDEIAEEKERAEDEKTEKKEAEAKSPPPPPPWSKYFSKNSLRVICSTCFAGNHHVRAPYSVHCDDELETDVYRNSY